MFSCTLSTLKLCHLRNSNTDVLIFLNARKGESRCRCFLDLHAPSWIIAFHQIRHFQKRIPPFGFWIYFTVRDLEKHEKTEADNSRPGVIALYMVSHFLWTCLFLNQIGEISKSTPKNCRSDKLFGRQSKMFMKS